MKSVFLALVTFTFICAGIVAQAKISSPANASKISRQELLKLVNDYIVHAAPFWERSYLRRHPVDESHQFREYNSFYFPVVYNAFAEKNNLALLSMKDIDAFNGIYRETCEHTVVTNPYVETPKTKNVFDLRVGCFIRAFESYLASR